MLTIHARKALYEYYLKRDIDVIKLQKFINDYKLVFINFVTVSMPFTNQLSKNFSIIIMGYCNPLEDLLNGEELYPEAINDYKDGLWIKRDAHFTSLMALEYLGRKKGFNKNRLKIANLLVEQGASVVGTLLSNQKNYTYPSLFYDQPCWRP